MAGHNSEDEQEFNLMIQENIAEEQYIAHAEEQYIAHGGEEYIAREEAVNNEINSYIAAVEGEEEQELDLMVEEDIGRERNIQNARLEIDDAEIELEGMRRVIELRSAEFRARKYDLAKEKLQLYSEGDVLPPLRECFDDILMDIDYETGQEKLEIRQMTLEADGLDMWLERERTMHQY